MNGASSLTSRLALDDRVIALTCSGPTQQNIGCNNAQAGLSLAYERRQSTLEQSNRAVLRVHASLVLGLAEQACLDFWHGNPSQRC